MTENCRGTFQNILVLLVVLCHVTKVAIKHVCCHKTCYIHAKTVVDVVCSPRHTSGNVLFWVFLFQFLYHGLRRVSFSTIQCFTQVSTSHLFCIGCKSHLLIRLHDVWTGEQNLELVTAKAFERKRHEMRLLREI